MMGLSIHGIIRWVPSGYTCGEIETNIHTWHHHKGGARGRRPRARGGERGAAHLVLDSLDAVEDDGAVSALDVVEAVEGGVEPRAANERRLHERAPARRRAGDPRSLEAHLAGGGGGGGGGRGVLARVLSSCGGR
jgi:hypothetical protein